MTKNYHFIGIGGIGMSALARILLSQKCKVSGSDIATNQTIQGLAQLGATIYKGQSKNHIQPDMTVIYSSDIKKENPEYLAAIRLQCQMLHRSDLLAELVQHHQSLAVAGTHGKTTTSALLATVLVEAGVDPSFAVGGMLRQFHANSRFGQGNLFAFEADESDGTFLKYQPFGAIVTNIDHDHLINYQNSKAVLVDSFKTFLSQVQSPEHLFWCGDDPDLKMLNPKGQQYGFSQTCDWKIKNFRQKEFSIVFDLVNGRTLYSNIEVHLTGRHNALNSAAVFGLAITLGLSEASIRQALKHFQGVMRRMEIKGTCQGALFLDDYAHHPTEIQATLTGLRDAIQEKRLIAIFQPHRYSRTNDCLGSYGTIFDTADHLIVTDIYAAGETPIPNVSHEQILEEVRQAGIVAACYVPRDQLTHELSQLIRPHDVVITLGAGDITKVGPDTIQALSSKEISKIKIGLIFGGSFTEHEVSIRSAKHFRDSLNKSYYAIEEFGITKKGTWLAGNNVEQQLYDILSGNRKDDAERPFSEEILKKLIELDVLIPVLHGPLGEDGTLQGLFESLKKAYVGCNHCAAAIAMDKLLCKKLVLQEGIRTAPFIAVSLQEWLSCPSSIEETILSTLSFPVFVKPSHLGSTVGVKKVNEKSELAQAIRYAFCHDTQLIVEQGIRGRELEFAVLGNDYIYSFPPGEILTNGAVYDYEAKYSQHHSITTTPCAELPIHLIEEGRQLAARAYQAISGCGLARVDFFLDNDGRYWFNEINPMPGFTATSLYPQICQFHGLNGSDLMDRLILLALHRRRQKNRIDSYQLSQSG